MSILLQAAYKVVDIPEHSCYDVGKDYVIPFLSTIIAFIGAVVVMRIQINKAKHLEEKKAIDEYNLIKKVYRINIEQLIIDLQQIKPKMDVELKDIQSKEIAFAPTLADFESPTLGLLTRLDYERIFKAFISTKDNVEIFNTSFRTVLRIENIMSRINGAINLYKTNNEETMEYCVNLNRDLFQLIRRVSISNNSLSDLILKEMGIFLSPKENISSTEINNVKNFRDMYKAIKNLPIFPFDKTAIEVDEKCRHGITKTESLDLPYLELKESYESFMEEYNSNINNLNGVLT